MLLKTFNVSLDENNEFYEINGTITSIENDTVLIKSGDNIYECMISDTTLVKTKYQEKDKVTIKYSGSTTVGDIVIVDNTLYLVVDENLL